MANVYMVCVCVTESTIVEMGRTSYNGEHQEKTRYNFTIVSLPILVIVDTYPIKLALS